MDAATRPTSRPPRFGAALAALLTVALVPAQEAPPTQAPKCEAKAAKPREARPKQAKPQPKQGPQRRKTRTFTAPDGSRFVLIQDYQQRQLHWALACWSDGRDDPPGFSGLTRAVLDVSLNGTWSTGSADAAAEKAALQALDESWQLKMSDPTNAENNAALLARDKAASDLGDLRTFRRVLAATPAHRPEILDLDGVSVLVLTTVEPALAEVARLLVERREQQALRGLARAWLPKVMARAQQHALHPERRIQAELLALIMPLSPAIAQLEAPPMTAPKRSQALASWTASQHPSRTVHLLMGAFDLDRTESLLKTAFATTGLEPPTEQQQRPLRQLGARRQSIVPGMPTDSVSLAWVLPADADPRTLEVATRWLADGDRARIRVNLRKKRPNVEVSIEAPWPLGARPALLRIDARDPGKLEGLAEDLIAACRQAATQKLTDGQYYAANMAVHRSWNDATANVRQLTVRLAQQALVWPTQTIAPQLPPIQKGDAIRKLLTATFASQPAIVEGHR